jgi:hypothetical protein
MYIDLNCTVHRKLITENSTWKRSTVHKTCDDTKRYITKWYATQLYVPKWYVTVCHRKKAPPVKKLPISVGQKRPCIYFLENCL